MKNYCAQLDQRTYRMVRQIGRWADGQSTTAYMVGGMVRDILLKKKVLDLDIVLNKDAGRFARFVAKKCNGRALLYPQFLTATVLLNNGMRIDFSVAREEYYSKGGALPKVKKGSTYHDLFRRDFTVNAMGISINKENFGQLIDIFGGVDDISAKKLRVLHEKSFRDDPTRILRAIRFESRLGFRMERATLHYCKAAIKKKAFKTIKPERFYQEFRKILQEKSVVKSLKRMGHLNALNTLNSGIQLSFSQLYTLDRNICNHQRELNLLEDFDFGLLYFLSILKNVSPSQRMKIIKKFPVKKYEIKCVTQLSFIDSITRELAKKSIKPSSVYSLLKRLRQEVVGYMFFCTNNKFIKKRITQYMRSLSVQLRITGNDIKRLGIDSQKKTGDVLNRIYCSKIDGEIITKRDELSLAKELITG